MSNFARSGRGATLETRHPTRTLDQFEGFEDNLMFALLMTSNTSALLVGGRNDAPLHVTK